MAAIKSIFSLLASHGDGGGPLEFDPDSVRIRFSGVGFSKPDFLLIDENKVVEPKFGIES